MGFATDIASPLSIEIRRRRSDLGLSREQLAAKAGLCSKTIELIENRAHRPRTSTLNRIAKALGVSAASLHAPSAVAA